MRTIRTAALAAVAISFFAMPAWAQAPWSATGALTDSDSVGEEQGRYDDHALQLTAGQRYRISVDSEAFDPVASLLRAGQAEPVAMNDDAGGTLNSRINYTPSESGAFTLRVRAFSADGRGAYTAGAVVLPPLAPGMPVPWSVSGQITDSDAGHVDEYTLRLEAGTRYNLTVNADAFDPVARLLRAGEEDVIAENDDSGGTLNSRISFRPTESGDYVLRVAPLGDDGRGAYTAAASVAPPLPAPNSTAGTPTQTTGTWNLWEGTLAAGDTDRDGTFFDDYLIHVEAGQIRYVSLQGMGIDPVVQILSVDGRDADPVEPLATDDDSGAGTDSFLTFDPAESGDYIVRVTSFSAASTGGYRLWISQ
jgi:hypothetical protein